MADISYNDKKYYNVKEGYGCLEDFYDACQYTGYQTKDRILNGGPNYQYHDEALTFLSCNNSNECAKEAVQKMKANDPTIDENFSTENSLQHSDMCLDVDVLGLKLPIRGFDTKAWCKSGRQFKSNSRVKDRATKRKDCYSVISFMCTSNGKTVKGGIGCMEDIKIACKGILSLDLENKIKAYNPFFYADKNIVVSAENGFHANETFEIFLKINPELTKPFYDNIDKNSDEICEFQKQKIADSSKTTTPIEMIVTIRFPNGTVVSSPTETPPLPPIVFSPAQPGKDKPSDYPLNYTLPEFPSSSNSTFNRSSMTTLPPIVFPPPRPTPDKPDTPIVVTLYPNLPSANSTFNRTFPEISTPLSNDETTSFYQSSATKFASKPQNSIFTGSCDAGEICYDSRVYLDNIDTDLKQCPGRCVYYKCLIRGDTFDIKYGESSPKYYNVKEGYGCLQDFYNACVFTGYQTKDQIANGGPNYQYHDDGLVFLSCNNSNECAKEAVEKMKAVDPSIGKNIGGQKSVSNDFVLHCALVWTFGIPGGDVETKAWCKSGRKFKSNAPVKNRASKNKYCDSILSFMCSTNGKLIKGGLGCMEDIKIACKGIFSSHLERKIKENPLYFFHADKNIVLSAGKGAYAETALDYYIKANPKLVKPFYDNIDGNSDELCEYQKPKKLTTAAHNSDSLKSSHAMLSDSCAIHGTTIMLQRQLIFGLTLIYFLCNFFCNVF
uniref:Uncharacterized protein n=1 Tax=Panagrolaimus sp. ES5 TaxID=591445 RepID=A0AC34GV59_9BILA